MKTISAEPSAPPRQVGKVTLNIDGVPHLVPAGMNLIDALGTLGVEIPHYCYHPKLSVAGNCRMCLVEMGTPKLDKQSRKPILGPEGKPQIQWMPKPQIACSSKTAEGLHLRLKGELTQKAREGVMEFLLLNHPLDCPICDQAGECHLQEFATDYGRGTSRFIEAKNTKPKNVQLGPRIILDNERCILCSRCIRFCDEILEEPTLGFTQRGSQTILTTAPRQSFTSNYSLNTADICPVGALTSNDFRFQMRTWFLKATPSICTESSAGVNTLVWAREGKVHRISPRRNDAVNDTWMTDSARTLYKQLEAKNRLTQWRTDHQNARPSAVIESVKAALQQPTACVVSGNMSLEEQWLLSILAKRHALAVHAIHHQGTADKLLLSEDRTPNLRGALLSGLIDTLPHPQPSETKKTPPKTQNTPPKNKDTLRELKDALHKTELKSLLVFNEDLSTMVDLESLGGVQLIYIGTHENAISQRADYCIPALHALEKTGSFVNRQFRLQKFHQAVPGPAGVLPELATLAALLELDAAPSLSELWEELSAQRAAFKGISWDKIPEEGLLIPEALRPKHSFCEQQAALHYQPEKSAV